LNPGTRVRQFSHLRDSALAQAILRLPAWEQLHEQNFMFNDLDVLIQHLIDVEGVTLSRG
jgi:hypothetical protein